MDNLLFELLDEAVPKFNPTIGEGVAVEHMKDVERYVATVIKCAEPGFPVGLKFESYQRCTPKEEYDFATKKKNNRRAFDIARNDLYLVKYYFSYNGEMLAPKHIYLPFVTDGGLITIRGSKFSISPVITDKAVSVGTESLFIPLTRAKLTAERILHHFYADGARESVYVIWSTVYNRSSKSIRMNGKPTIQANHTLVHYLFCKYGVTNTFKYFAGTDVLVGDIDTINDTTCPPSEWVICNSTGMKPHGIRDKYYTSTQLQMAVRRCNYNPTVATMVGGFFYIVDHFPLRVLAEYCQPDYPEEKRMWMTLLGHLIFGSNVSDGKLYEDIEAHMRSLDEYIDDMARETLREENIHCSDLYQLFMYIIENMHTMVLDGNSQVGSMYGKRLTVLRYVLSNVIAAIFNFMFKLRSNTKKVLERKDIETALHKIGAETITQINKNHGEVSSISSPGDNKLLKITSNVVLQANSAGHSKSKAALGDASKHLHSSIAEVNQYGNLPKSDPTGRSRLNPCVMVNPDGTIVRNPKHLELLDRVESIISR